MPFDGSYPRQSSGALEGAETPNTRRLLKYVNEQGFSEALNCCILKIEAPRGDWGRENIWGKTGLLGSSPTIDPRNRVYTSRFCSTNIDDLVKPASALFPENLRTRRSKFLPVRWIIRSSYFGCAPDAVVRKSPDS